MDPTGSEESVLKRVTPFVWDNDESVGYEITIEAINEVIGLYVAKSHAEEARRDHDQEALNVWAGERQKWHAVRQSLNPADQEGMRQVREECRELSARLRTE